MILQRAMGTFSKSNENSSSRSTPCLEKCTVCQQCPFYQGSERVIEHKTHPKF